MKLNCIVKDLFFVTILILIALGLRVFFLIYIDIPFVFRKYPYFADQLINGIDINTRLLDLSPFYLYFVAAVKKYFNTDIQTLKFLHALIGTCNTLLLFRLGKIIKNTGVGLVGAFLYACYGNGIALELSLEPLVFYELFTLLTVMVLMSFTVTKQNDYKLYVYVLLAAIFSGISILIKPNFVLFIPVALLTFFFVLKKRISAQKNCILSVGYVLITLAVVSPVTIRNYNKFNDFVLVTADYGKVFFHGNSKGSSPFFPKHLPYEIQGSWGPDGEHEKFRKAADILSGKALLPSQAARYWVSVTLKDIFSDPFSYLLLEIQKFQLFFHEYEIHYLLFPFIEYQETKALPFIRYGLISTLGLLGIIIMFSERKKLIPLYGIISIYLISGMMLLVSSRYRAPAVPFLCLFAALFLNRFIEYLKKREMKKIAVAIVLCCILFYINHSFYADEIKFRDNFLQETYIKKMTTNN
ncbi:MAG: glycosyltransferase family 39 protein [Proteobacteria bacterium]|nr:glycosyltransferase family 39 protein [Pseudomonadota bacterium]MBU1709672.1 glycosyltransferase family 39 protein [Pseudomonadota bacterium]